MLKRKMTEKGGSGEFEANHISRSKCQVEYYLTPNSECRNFYRPNDPVSSTGVRENKRKRLSQMKKAHSKDISVKYNVYILFGSQFKHTNYKNTLLR